MAQTSDEALESLRDVWKQAGQSATDIDQACEGRHKKVCRNSVHMTFDGYAEEGEDVRTAWRRRLESEGKFNAAGAGTLRDLIFGAAGPSGERH